MSVIHDFSGSGPARPVFMPTDQTYTDVVPVDVQKCGVKYVDVDGVYGVQFPLHTSKELVSNSKNTFLFKHTTTSGVVYERRYYSMTNGRYIISSLSTNVDNFARIATGKLAL